MARLGPVSSGSPARFTLTYPLPFIAIPCQSEPRCVPSLLCDCQMSKISFHSDSFNSENLVYPPNSANNYHLYTILSFASCSVWSSVRFDSKSSLDLSSISKIYYSRLPHNPYPSVDGQGYGLWGVMGYEGIPGFIGGGFFLSDFSKFKLAIS